MHPFLIMNDADLERAHDLIEELWDAEPGTPAGHLLAVMSTLVDQYEAERSTLPPGDPIELIAFKLDELGWSQRELARKLGWGSGRVSEILNRKRRLTLAMVQQLSTTLGLPPGVLVPDTDDEGGWARVVLPPDVAHALARAARGRGSTVQDVVTQILREVLCTGAEIASAHVEPAGTGVATPIARSLPWTTGPIQGFEEAA